MPALKKRSQHIAKLTVTKKAFKERHEEVKEKDEFIIEERMINEINHYLNNKQNISAEEKDKLQAILQYLCLYKTGIRKGDASKQIAYLNGKSSYWARCLIFWTNEWRISGKITLSYRGRHPKTKSISVDDLFSEIRVWLCDHKFDITPYLLQKHVNEVLLPNMSNSEKKFISIKTAARWLKSLGWIWSEVKIGIYVDGHERADVVEYRIKFLQQMKEYLKRMIYTDSPDKSDLDTLQIDGDERPLVFYTHDESIFYSNESNLKIWHPIEQMPLRKKGKGRSIMVSSFISEVCGELTYTQNGIKIEAREIIHPGKIHDGYWGGEDVAKQFRKAIAIHKLRFPEYDALWAFDNSCNHCCFAKDALRVGGMNLSPGGKQALMRDGFFNGQRQKMVFPARYPIKKLRGKAKGMKQVLQERGL